nr:hypothetical protein [Tanacetum cinerariifolium]
MSPKMTTRSLGRSTVVPRGGRMGRRTGRGGGRTGEPTGRVGGRTGDQDGQGGDRGSRANGGIMSPKMTTRSLGRSTVVPRGGRMGRRTGRGGGRTGEPTGRVGGRTGDQDGQGGDRGSRANGGVDEVPDFSSVIAQELQNLLPTIIAQVGNHTNNIEGDVRNVSVSNGRGDCSYKEFLACNLNDYDGKGVR